MESKKEKEKIVFFDEFAVYERPSIFYGWAEKNTRPEVPSNEKGRRNKLTRTIQTYLIHILPASNPRLELMLVYYRALSLVKFQLSKYLCLIFS